MTLISSPVLSVFREGNSWNGRSVPPPVRRLFVYYLVKSIPIHHTPFISSYSPLPTSCPPVFFRAPPPLSTRLDSLPLPPGSPSSRVPSFSKSYKHVLVLPRTPVSPHSVHLPPYSPSSHSGVGRSLDVHSEIPHYLPNLSLHYTRANIKHS